VLAGMDAGAACARPVAGGHTAAEVLEHMAAWRDFGTSALEGRRAHPSEDGWRRIEALSVSDWEALKGRVEESLRRLAAAIRAAAPARLAENRDRLRFILHHDIYHAGQVGLLRRAGPMA